MFTFKTTNKEVTTATKDCTTFQAIQTLCTIDTCSKYMNFLMAYSECIVFMNVDSYTASVNFQLEPDVCCANNKMFLEVHVAHISKDR